MAPKGVIFLSTTDDAASALIPCRCEAGIHEALVFRQACDRLHVLFIEPDIERVEIGFLAFGARGFRDRGNTVLVEQPFQRPQIKIGLVIPLRR
jgi:hypothetical protein